MKNAGFERAGVFDMPDHLIEKAAFADGGDRHKERAGSVDRSADERVAFHLLDGQRLAGHQRLVDTGMAAGHDAVGRDALAGANPNMIADSHFLDRQLDFQRAPNNAGRFRLQVQKPFYCLRAAGLDDERQPFREDVIGADHH